MEKRPVSHDLKYEISIMAIEKTKPASTTSTHHKVKSIPKIPSRINIAIELYKAGFDVVPLMPGERYSSFKWKQHLKIYDREQEAIDARKNDYSIPPTLLADLQEHPDFDLAIAHDDRTIDIDPDTPEAEAMLLEAHRLCPEQAESNYITKTPNGRHLTFGIPAGVLACSTSDSTTKNPSFIDMKTGKTGADIRNLCHCVPSKGYEIIKDEIEGNVANLVPISQKFLDTIQELNGQEPWRPYEGPEQTIDYEGQRITTATVKKFLEHISPLKRKEWMHALWGVHNLYGGSQEGLDIILEWSAETHPLDGGEVCTQWRAAKNNRKSRITFGTVVAMADRGGCDKAAIYAADVSEQVEKSTAAMRETVKTYDAAQESKKAKAAETKKAVTAKPKKTAKAATTKKEVIEFPEGVLADLANYTLDGANRPNREMALGSALSYAAGILKHAYALEFRLTTLALFIQLVAPTTTGKETPLTGPKDIFNELVYGPDHPLAGNERLSNFAYAFTSGAALIQALKDQPDHCIFQIYDECGAIFNGQAKNAMAYHRDLMPTMNTVFTTTKEQKWDPRHAKKSDETIESFRGANLNFLGCIQPKTLLELMSQSTIDNGFVGRFIFFMLGDTVAPNNIRAQFDPIKRAAIQKHFQAVSEEVDAILDNPKEGPRIVKYGEGSDIYLQDHGNSFDKALLDEELGGIRGRTTELAARVAGVIAVHRNPQKPVITMDDAKAAVKIISRSHDRMEAEYLTRVTTEFGVERDKILNLLRNIPTMNVSADMKRLGHDKHLTNGEMPHSLLLQRMQRYSKNFKEAINTLIDSGLVTRSYGGDKKDVQLYKLM